MKDNKIYINELFERLIANLNKLKILFASDAFDLKINNKNIEKIVQFRLSNII